MKSLNQYINEKLSKEKEKFSGVIGQTIKQAIDTMEDNGYTFDKDYNKWTSGEDLTLRFTKENTDKFVDLIVFDNKGKYNGDNFKDIENVLKISSIEITTKSTYNINK